MLNSRQKKILELIVREFVKTAEPVASQIISQNYDIGCCSATVRNEMVKLEELGYIEQPHASAGRIPKDKAYRVFVDEIINNKIGPPPESAAVIIEKEYDLIQTHLEHLLDKTARLLSHLTRYTSLLLAPRLRKSFFKYLKLVSLSANTILLFMMTNTGSIIHRTIEISKPIAPEDLDRITNLLNIRLQGALFERIENLVHEIPNHDANYELIQSIIDLSQKIEEEPSREVFFGGRTHLIDLIEFKDINRIKMLMELLEDEKVVAEILDGTIHGDCIQVLIGEENPVDGMRECSMITATYNIDGKPVGTLGIIGPKRMPYEQIIPIVNYTAENFSNKLQKLEKL